MQHFLETSVKGLRGHGVRCFLSTMHVMEETIVSSNGASGGCNMIETGVADFVEGIGRVCSIVIFNIRCFLHGLRPDVLVVGITQNMILVSGTELLN